jgi:flagellin-like hook-associated protein FlgL
LKQKSTDFQEMISQDIDVDMPKLLIDLQNQQYILDMSYKMASMILPKSLMDFL